MICQFFLHVVMGFCFFFLRYIINCFIDTLRTDLVLLCLDSTSHQLGT